MYNNFKLERREGAAKATIKAENWEKYFENYTKKLNKMSQDI